jgi:hypothetical protein
MKLPRKFKVVEHTKDSLNNPHRYRQPQPMLTKASPRKIQAENTLLRAGFPQLYIICVIRRNKCVGHSSSIPVNANANNLNNECPAAPLTVMIVRQSQHCHSFPRLLGDQEVRFVTAVRPCPDKQARGIAVASLILRMIAPAVLITVLLVSATCSAQISSQSSTQAQSSITTSSAASFTPASISISGRVINAATGLPVPRALVRFGQRAMLADREGRFQFDQVTDTTINLQAVKPGFSMTTDPSDPGGQSFQVAQITGPLEIRLYPEAILTGAITSLDGAPLAQISVIARRSTYDEVGHRWTVAGQTQTDRHGDFRLPVPPGDYKLETRYSARNAVSSDAVLPVTLPASGGIQTIHLRPGQEEHFDIQPPVRPTYPVSFGVESHGERGIPAVTAHTSDGASFSVGVSRGPDQPQNQTQNQNQTQATFNLPTGTYTLTARAQDRDTSETAETRVSVTGSSTGAPQASGAILRFVPTPSIPVELSIDPDATSDNTTTSSLTTSPIQSSNTSGITSPSIQNLPTIQQFGVSLQRLDSTSEDDPQTISLSAPRNGTSTFSAPPGTYRLVGRNASRWYIRSANYGNTDLLTDPLILSAGAATATIHLVVSNLTGSLRGTVLLNGLPASSWLYLIATVPSIPSVITVHSGSSGALNNPYLPPGTYRAIAFERRHSADFTNPETLARFASYAQTVTITSGAASSVNLNAVPQLDVDSEAHP